MLLFNDEMSVAAVVIELLCALLPANTVKCACHLEGQAGMRRRRTNLLIVTRAALRWFDAIIGGGNPAGRGLDLGQSWSPTAETSPAAVHFGL